jgi:ferredoxin-type protein NapH
MAKAKSRQQKWPVRPLRRLCQLAVLSVLIVVPWLSQSPGDWTPSRIIQGQLPAPTLSSLSGDTWSFSVGDFFLTHPVAFVESWVVGKVLYLPLLLSVLIPLLMTMVLGRFFCSWMCPVGLILELNGFAGRLLEKAGVAFRMIIPDFRYPLLFVSLIFGFLFSFPLIAVFDPPHLLGREIMYFFTHQAVSLTGVGFLLAIIFFELLVSSRSWCRCFCPSGAGLALFGNWRFWRIRMDEKKCTRCSDCDAVCPYELTPSVLADGSEFGWLKCDNCGLCRDVCPTGALAYGIGQAECSQIQKYGR